MGENRKFVGQPILSQIIDSSDLSTLRRKHKSDRYYKRLPVRKHLACLFYGVFSYCNGLRELCEGLMGCEGKLTHLRLDTAPARSTLSDANRNRSYLIFEDLYFNLVGRYQSFISDSRLKGLSIRNLKIIDSTTIRLFSDILCGVGRNPTNGSRKKGGIKGHSMMDAFSGIVDYVHITAAKVHDRKFLYHFTPPKNSFLVFDKAYNHYKQFDKWTTEHIWFVTRMKTNAKFHVTKVLQDKRRRKTLRVS
ncbi:MAG: transposase [Bacteroidetes bacterium]|nr:transposase [Bacteroidota bacterium]